MPAGNITITKVRLSYPHVFKRETKYNKFSATFLISKTTEEGKETTKKIKAEYDRICKESFDGKVPAFTGHKYPIRDGDDLDQNGDAKGAEYAGHWYVTAKSDSRPNVFNNDKTAVAEEDNIIYAGCYVHGLINLYAVTNKETKGVYVGLKGVMFHKDGEAFGSKGANADDFEDVDDMDDGI